MIFLGMHLYRPKLTPVWLFKILLGHISRTRERSRATVNSEAEPVARREELERALVDQPPAAQGTAHVSSTQPQTLPGAQDRDGRPLDTFHTAMQGNFSSMLKVNAKIDALEAEMRMMRTDLLALRAQPNASDVINDFCQLRTDYNAEREANSAL